MRKYRVPTGLKHVIAFIYHFKGSAINFCVKEGINFDKIEEFEEND